MPDLARAAWLQAMMTHRLVTDKQCRALHKAATKAARVDYRASNYDNFVHEASAAITGLGLEIRRIVDEWTSKPLVALVNTKGDEIAQLATTYTPQEIAFVKRLAEVIFTAQDETFSCTMMHALNVAGRGTPPMTKKAAEELVHNLVRHQWLRMSPSGRLFLAPRTLIELEPWLKEQYPEHVLECAKCHDIVTKGSACSNTSCSGRLHHACERSMPNARNGQAKCYVCKEDWDPVPVGEDSLGSGRRPNRRRSSQAVNTQGADEEEEEEEETEREEEMGDEDEDFEATQQQRQRKRKSTSAGSSGAGGGRRRSTSSTVTATRTSARRRSSASGAQNKRRRSSRAVAESDEDDEEDDGDGDDGDEEEEEEEEEEEDTSRRRRPRASATRSSARRGGRSFVDEEAGEGEDEDE